MNKDSDSYQIVSLDSREQWEHILDQCPHTPYHTWEYCIFMFKSSGNPIYLFVAKIQSEFMICTYSIREKIKGYPELYTPYGFGGFYSTSNLYLNEFRKIWIRFAKENNLVTGYIMQHPLSDIWEMAHEHLPIYVLDLAPTIAEIWSKLRKGHKHEINKFLKDNDIEIVSQKSELAEPFIKTYHETMKRVNASSVYHFSSEALEGLLHSDQSIILGAKDKHGLKSFVLFLFCNEKAEYFLSASIESKSNYTRMLIWKGIEELKLRKVRKLNLGGGVKPNDSLESFKRRFGGKKYQVKVLKEVFNEPIFNSLCNDFIKNEDTSHDFFPPYWKNQN